MNRCLHRYYVASSIHAFRTYLCCAICGEVLASRHHDETQQREHQHQGESDGSVPEIENLGDRHRASRAHDVRHGADDGEERVSLESTRDVGREVGRETGFEGPDEIHRPHALFFGRPF